MQIQYKKMSLFDVEPGNILVHAVNAQGVWGGGIAREFKRLYPTAYHEYQHFCTDFYPLGYSGLAFTREKHAIGWVCTSFDYGKNKDSKDLIKIHTTTALFDLLRKVQDNTHTETIYSNKFNSGLFAVPWEETELILKTVLKMFPQITWIVCDPNHVGD